MLVATSIILIAHEHRGIVWAVTGVVGALVLAFPEALNIATTLKCAGRSAGMGGSRRRRPAGGSALRRRSRCVYTR